MDFDDAFDSLREEEYKIIRSPIPYPGGKSRSITHLLEYLPYRKKFIDVFGGSGTVLLARQPSPIEVFNDLHSGIVAFYRCLKDPDKLEHLIEWLELTVYSREDFIWCKDTWEYAPNDVECAARWFYMVNASFGSIGRSFGRSINTSTTFKIRHKIKNFNLIHERLKNVLIEHTDWEQLILDYDSSETVFYLDPPYVDAYDGSHTHTMSIERHRDMLNRIFECKGFVAISGYSNPLYENCPWTDRHEWESFVSIRSIAYTKGNKKLHLKDIDSEREHTTEVLWIKE